MSLSVVDQIVRGHGTLVTVRENGQAIGCLEYDWVKDYDDMLRADHGEHPIGGEVLYVSNVRIMSSNPSIIWKLRKQLPSARWIVGLTEQWELRAPKGVPDGFYQIAA